MELLEDHRFLYELNETQKGLYLMLLALAGKTNNKIKDDLTFIRGRLNLQSIVHKDLEKISEVYKKFKLTDGYWGFENFDKEHNQILSKGIGISQGYPKDSQRIYKNRIEKNREEKKGVGNKTNEQFLEELKTKPEFSHINLPLELKKMDDWLADRPGRKKTRRFVLGWLGRVEAPLPKEADDPYASCRKIVL